MFNTQCSILNAQQLEIVLMLITFQPHRGGTLVAPGFNPAFREGSKRAPGKSQ
jgi:hypothetical protein